MEILLVLQSLCNSKIHSIPLCRSKVAGVFPYTTLCGSQQESAGGLIQLNGNKMTSFLTQIHFWDSSQSALEGDAKINVVGCRTKCILKKEVILQHNASLKVCIQGTLKKKEKSLFFGCKISFTWNRSLGLFYELLSLVLCTGLHDVTCMTCCLMENCVTCTVIMDHSTQSDCWAYSER